MDDDEADRENDFDHDGGGEHECGCCFSDYAIGGMAQCNEGHLFCHTCVAGYVKEMVSGGSARTTDYAVKCLSTAGAISDLATRDRDSY